jgi:hypothetical protein
LGIFEYTPPGAVTDGNAYVNLLRFRLVFLMTAAIAPENASSASIFGSVRHRSCNTSACTADVPNRIFSPPHFNENLLKYCASCIYYNNSASRQSACFTPFQ